MIPLAVLAPIFLAHLAAAVSPGPAVLMTARVSAGSGFGPGVAFAAGVGLGAMIWAAAALGGMTLLFQIVPGLLLALKLAGAAFLIWIGMATWRGASEPLPEIPAEAARRSIAAGIRFGLTLQLTNPKPAVFFGAVFAALVPPGLGLAQLALILVMVGAVELIWNAIVARIFSRQAARAGYARLKTRIERAFGVLLAGFGVAVAVE